MLSANSFKLLSRRLRRVAIGALGAGIVAIASLSALDAATPPVTRFVGPTSSQPLALTADGAFLVVANPDNNTVSFFDVRGDKNRKLAEVPVQTEPWGVAFLPDGRKAYVANTVSGTVSMIRTNIRNGIIHKPKHITVGTEPYGLALTPNGTRLYVTNARSNSITVIDTANDQVVETITNVGFEPRGLAITNDGDDDDTDEKVYVTQFLSLPTAGEGRRAGRRQERLRYGDFDDRQQRHRPGNHQSDCRYRFQSQRAMPWAHPPAASHRARCEFHFHHRRVSEPAQQHRDQGQLRLHSQHRRLAQRPGALRRQHA